MESKKTRILFTISNFNTAGSGKVLYDLIRGLDANQFEIEIACGSHDGGFFTVVESLGSPIHIFQTKTPYKPYYNLWLRIWKISKFYKQQQYDIIHSWQWSSDWTEALAAKLAGIRWIYTKKAMGFDSKHWKIKSYLADFIVTINEEMRDYFPYKKAQALIPLGIDTDYYSSHHFSDEINTIDSNFHIITIANLVPVKGLEVLIQALHKLNNSDIQLTVVGKCDNDYGLAMQALTKTLGMEHSIFFVGKQMDVRPYIAKANLYVIPTLDEGRKEGMPMALVEAMSMGIPVLGSDITGINFVLKDFNSLLFPAGDFHILADKIKYMQSLDSSQRKQIGKSLRAYCKINYSLSTFILAHETLYNELV